MTTQIKAIQTRYKGYLFRSRLEARWAVFFDSVGEPWEYEKEGFELQSGWYLPDFWIPRLETWVEIKPERNTLETIKPKALCEELSSASGFISAIVYGLPLSEVGEAFVCKYGDSGGGICWQDFIWDIGLDHLIFLNSLESDSAFGRPDCTCPTDRISVKPSHFELNDPETQKFLIRCADDARSARFEHGQSGAM